MKSRPGPQNTLKVIELFAGVGGFRTGLDQASEESPIGFETVWTNQWEPSTKNQHAAWTYEHAFFHKNGITDPETIHSRLSNEDINAVVNDPARLAQIPDHDVLTGGFPCQDYSVARPLSQAKGIDGKKGVLWWSIQRILEHKIEKGSPVPYVFLENVDRLLKSPASKRGRDFAIILTCLNGLGYVVEWRVINAGEYGFPQRRRRTFILAYHKDAPIRSQFEANGDLAEWVTTSGMFAKAFPATYDHGITGSFSIDKNPHIITKDFRVMKPMGTVDSDSPFQNAGMIVNGRIFTTKSKPVDQKKMMTLGSVIRRTKAKDIPEEYLIPASDKKRWAEQKEGHAFERTSKTGHAYHYTEGAMAFPDHLDRPSRTIITSEGGKTPTRFKHVICTVHDEKKKALCTGGKACRLRRLIPEELEELCMFDRGHTAFMRVPGKDEPVTVPATKRAFFMGNALVVGVIEQIGRELSRRHTGVPHAAERTSVRREKMRS